MKQIRYTSPEISNEAQKLIDRDRKVMFGAHTRTREIPLVVDHAQGARVTDINGRTYLDFGAGFAVVGTGHCHPDVIKAVNGQIQKLIHISGSDFYYEPQIALAEKIIEITPGAFGKRVYFGSSGAEAVETTLKIARHFRRRPRMISFIGAFHGRTFAGMTMSGSKKIQRGHFSALIPEVYHVPFPYCYRCVFDKTYPACISKDFDGVPLPHCVSYLSDVIFERLIDPEDVSLILVEPIQGEGGFITPPPEYFPKIQKIAGKYDIALIIDEVQTGVGRTGKFFAIEHWRIAPDILTLAKSLAGGMPLSAIIARKEMINKIHVGGLGGTFSGNPVSCRAGLAVLEVLLEDNLLQRAEKLGQRVLSQFQELQEKYEIIGDIRGKGPMLAMELVRDRETKEPAKEEADKLVKLCYDKGLVLLSCGNFGNVIRTLMPLVITDEQLERGLSILEEGFQKLTT